MSILDKLTDKNEWLEYLYFKESQSSISKEELEKLRIFVLEEKYKDIATSIINDTYSFSIPTKHLINKINKSKKRVVYSFNEEENYILKLITYLFSKHYDNCYSKCCYSFRKSSGVKEAIKAITSKKDLNLLYGYKIDISNYFNSVDVKLLLEKLKSFLKEDLKLYNLIVKLLIDKRVIFNDEIICESKGIMAGVPISSFLANVFLTDVDKFFEGEDVLYLRYSDDIIIFAEEYRINEYIKILNSKIAQNNLTINEDKKLYIKPGQKWDFLGFSFENGAIDLSKVAKDKIKGKIKRSCRKLRRWILKKNADSSRAISAVIRKFNRKFYMVDNTRELTWSLWYFPVINTVEGLHEIDEYMQQELRYIATGKHNKKNYNITYERLKELGYKPLVSEYYKFKDNKKKEKTL